MHTVEKIGGTSMSRVDALRDSVLIRDGDRLVGAVGVSGDTSDNDEICAMAGIQAAGFTAETGA